MQEQYVTFIDLFVLGAYFIATVAIGFFFWKRSRSVSGFTAGDGQVNSILTGLSILGTYISSISFLALPGKAFSDNWNSFAFSLSIPFAVWIAVRWFMPFYRGTGEVSAYSHLQRRFGRWACIYASLCYLLTQLARVGTVTYLMALPMSVLLGIDIRIVILVTGIATTVYTFAGGIVGVIWTDAIQTIILMLGALVCAVIMLFSLPNGPMEVFNVGVAHEKFSLGSFDLNLTDSTFWVVLIYGLVINLQNFGIDQNYVQRYHAARSNREAAKSIWLGGLVYVPVSALFFFIGSALFAYYYSFPELLPAAYGESGKGDSVFPWFIVTELPAGVTGLLVASIFAAAMSTISSSLNSSATVVLNDYYMPFRGTEKSERAKILILYGATVAVGVVGSCLAVALVGVPSILDAWWLLAGVFGGGTLGLFLLGFLSKRVSNRPAIVGVLVGLVVILWMTVSPNLGEVPSAFKSGFHGYLVVVFGTATILIIGFVAAYFMQKRNAG